MSTPPRLLMIDDDSDVAIAAQILLRRPYGEMRIVHHPAAVPAALKDCLPDVVLLDFNFTAGRTDGLEGLALLDLLRQQNPPPAVIAITAYADIPLAVEALKRGACDFITKPWDNARLLAAVDAAIVRHAPINTVRTEANSALDLLMGHSRKMQELRAMIAHVAPTEANVMILGENGVGKELVARAIHACSPRLACNFLAVDMGAVPESTFESELYGHRKGAFTDARNDRLGRFQAAKAGVLFLDEIGNLPLSAQAKLLAALERREVTPVGADKPEKIDVRIVSATNLSELALFDPSVFRTDLLFRLNTIVLRVPALRERAEDIPELVEHYVRHYERQYHKSAKAITPESLHSLSVYHWPGNVRALRHACERAVILGTHIDYHIDDFGLADVGIAAISNSLSETGMQNPTVQSKEQEPITLSDLEKTAITKALTQAKGNISQAAKSLGLSRAALYRKMEKYAL